MYEDFYAMRHTPFVRNIPVGNLYKSSCMAEVAARLNYAAERQLFTVLTGEVGCGKTTQLRCFAENLSRQDFVVIYVSENRLTPTQFYNAILSQLNQYRCRSCADARASLRKELDRLREVQKKQVVCILDEAHLVEQDTLEDLRFLLNSNFDSESPLTLILTGEPELRKRLYMQPCIATSQRIDMNCLLTPLDRAETEQYIQTHLDWSGTAQKNLFTDRALEIIWRESAGLPRLINRICEKCLMCGSQQKQHLIDDHLTSFVIEHEF